MATGLELRRVQKGKGKVHLTPAVPEDAPVHTLCGQEFAPGSVEEVAAQASCSICLRRRNDPAAVSSAFFMENAGEQVLELSLAQARARQPRPKPAKPEPAPPPERKPKPRRTPEPGTGAPPAARHVGELDATGLREFSEDVYLAPSGAVVRMEDGSVAEIVGEGQYQLLRRGGRLTLRAGGVVVEAQVSELRARLAR